MTCYHQNMIRRTLGLTLLIGGMACLGHQDGFPMVSALAYVMHGHTINHAARLSIVMIHQVTILHGLSTLRGY